MYSVSQAYKEALKQTSRNWLMEIHVETLSGSTLTFTADDVIEGSFFLEDEVMAGENIALGTVNASALNFSVDNVDDRFDNIQFYGAKITPIISLEVSEGVFEPVPMGVFTVIEAPRSIKTPNKPIPIIPLTCYDSMYLLDEPFKKVTVNFPCTAGNLLQAICFHCGVTRDTSAVTFLNSDYLISTAPDGDLSCRDILSYIAQLAGCWAEINRQGQLTFKWFQNPAPVFGLDGGNFTDYQSGDIVDGGTFTDYQSGDKADGGYFSEVQGMDNCFDFSLEDTPITITGVALKRDESILLAGEERYVIEIDNPLIQNNAETILTSISNKITGLAVLAFNSFVRDDPAIDGGDLIEFNINGKCYRTVIFRYRYKYRGKCQLTADPKTEIRQGIKSPTTRKMSVIREKIAKKQQQLDALDLAIKNASQMIAGMWGGHVINGDTLGGEHAGNMYIADNENPSLAQKIWRWNLGGLGYSSNGINGPFTAAITADGSIVASLITASMIQTGLLQSLNGKSWIDLDNGAFSMGDGALKWDAVNGFEAVSAKKISTPGSTVYGEIGHVGTAYGLRLIKDDGSAFLSALLLTSGGFNLWNKDYPVLTGSPNYTDLLYGGNRVFYANSDQTSLLLNNKYTLYSNGTHTRLKAVDKTVVWCNGSAVTLERGDVVVVYGDASKTQIRLNNGDVLYADGGYTSVNLNGNQILYGDSNHTRLQHRDFKTAVDCDYDGIRFIKDGYYNGYSGTVIVDGLRHTYLDGRLMSVENV